MCDGQAGFYVYVKSPIADDFRLCERLAERGVLVAPSTLFHDPGYIRLSLTARHKSISAALPVFEQVLRDLHQDVQEQPACVESLLTVNNFCWGPDGAFRPPMPLDSGRAEPGALAQVHGRFACASTAANGGSHSPAIDLGLNKLFVSLDETGAVLAGSFLIDLIRRGAPFECIYSVPPGHVVELGPDPGRDSAPPVP